MTRYRCRGADSGTLFCRLALLPLVMLVWAVQVTLAQDTVPPQRGLIMLDRTDSVSSGEYPDALVHVSEALPDITRQRRVSKWEIGNFPKTDPEAPSKTRKKNRSPTDTDPAQTPRTSFLVRIGPPAPESCPTPAAKPDGSPEDTKGARDERVKEWEDADEARIACLAESTAWTKAFAKISDDLKVPDPCHHCYTCLRDLLVGLRSSRAALTAVVVSDGLENCNQQDRPVPKPDADVAVVVVLLRPSTARLRTTDPLFPFEARRDLILRIAPWVRDVVSPLALSADSFEPRSEPAAP